MLWQAFYSLSCNYLHMLSISVFHNSGSPACEEQWPMWNVRLALIVDHLITYAMSVQNGAHIQKAFLGKVPGRLLV